MSLRQLKNGTQRGTLQDQTSGGSKNFETGGDNLSAPSSFIANAHNKIYAFLHGKSGFLTKYETIGKWDVRVRVRVRVRKNN